MLRAMEGKVVSLAAALAAGQTLSAAVKGRCAHSSCARAQSFFPDLTA